MSKLTKLVFMASSVTKAQGFHTEAETLQYSSYFLQSAVRCCGLLTSIYCSPPQSRKKTSKHLHMHTLLCFLKCRL